MNEIVISHKSAFIFWRCFSGKAASLKRTQHVSACDERIIFTPALREEVQSLGFRLSPHEPLDLLFADPSLRIAQPGIRSHVASSALPRNTFLRLSEHVLIVCPELCLIQNASRLSPERLILMCTEFCGTYTPFAENREERNRVALTSVSKLGAYASKALSPKGGLRFRRALCYALDGAASPMEARVALMMCLPNALGGYGLPTPKLNYPHSLSEKALGLYPCSPCRLDICWPDSMLAIEYDGSDHEKPGQHARDVARLNALALDGFDIAVITYAQALSTSSFDAIARKVAKQLHCRIRERIDDFPARQLRLREEFDLA